MSLLQILSTPGCAACKQAKEIIAKVAPEFPTLKVEEVPLVENPELAGKYGIMSAPALVLDGELLFASPPSEANLRAKLTEKLGANKSSK